MSRSPGSADGLDARAGLGSAPAPTPVPQPPVGLYLHVPFCVSRCPYCDFVVVAGSSARGPGSRIPQFVDAVRREIHLRADASDARHGPRPPLQSLYLGGGTPSLLPTDELAALIETVRDRFGLTDTAEITLEANPGPDERGDAGAQRRAGVTRISFGAQSLDDAELRRLGRRHRARDVVDAVAVDGANGIDSISIDLLYDIPDTSLDTWMSTLETTLEIDSDHVSLYALTLDDLDAEGLTGAAGDHLPSSRGARRWRDGARAGQDDDRAIAQYHLACGVLGDAGYRGYEISSWAKSGHESRHNLAYWRRLPVEAVGPGAHAFDGVTRRWNAARLDTYVMALADGRLPPGGAAAPDDAEAIAAESIILALRLDTGVPLTAAHEPPLAGAFDWALAAELVAVTDDARVVLTTRGRLLSNELFARIV